MTSITLPRNRTDDSTPAPTRLRRLASRVARGRADDPPWVRPALLALLAATAVLYVWGLGESGWANAFYSGAVQAGTKSWKAFFFGSSDAANFITVDKSPASLWVMELSARVFGLSSWSILVPQALEGVAAVALLYATVRRWFPAGAAFVAAATLAVTPAATLMFRFNNPDALLVLVLVAAAYALTRALEHASTRWLLLAWGLVGVGFLAKMLQALMVAPAFGLVYLLCAPTTLRRRLAQSALALVALVASAGWWVAVVELWPASSRPYIGGSQDNSVLDLIFGYNGFGRLTGDETGSVGGGGGGGRAGGMWGPTGIGRLFNQSFGGFASWLLPAALVLLVAGVAWCGRAARTDRTRAAFGIWGGWLLVTGLGFSYGQGIIHEYYTVALAPAIGALVGMGAAVLWRHRASVAARLVLVATIGLTAWWSTVLLDRTPGWHAWLRPVIVLASALAAVGVLVAAERRTLGRLAAGVALVAGLAGPTAYSLATAATPHTGSIPSVGPAAARVGPGGRGPGGQGGTGGFGGFGQGGPGGFGQGGPGGVGQAGAGGTGTGRPTPPAGTTGAVPAGAAPTGAAPTGGPSTGLPGGGQGGPGGGIGGLLDASTPSAELVATLQEDASRYTWVAAIIGANQAAGYQLATGDPVMALGGFNGTDPWPTLDAFKAYVAAGRVHWFLGGTGFGAGMNGSSATSEIAAWVRASFTATTVGGVTLYDLTAPVAG